MPDETLPQRTIKTTFLLVSFFSLVFAVRGQFPIACGLALGGALGLFSLWSLLVAIPRLFHANNPASRLLLGLMTVCKLPIYAGTLYFAMASPAINAFSVFVGVAMIPTVLVLKTVGYQMLQRDVRTAGDETCQANPAPSK